MKKIAVVLILLLLIQAVPIDSFNYGESVMTIDKLVNMSEADLEAISDIQIFQVITSSDNYPPNTDGKLSYDGEIHRVDVDLNIDSFRKYRQIIYGVPFDKQSDYGGKVLDKSEPKYLGFNRKGEPMTNDKYPGANLGKEPPEKAWIVKSGQYADSWSKFRGEDNENNELYNHMLKTDTINSDAVGRYTLEEVLQNTDGMSNLSSYIGSSNETLRSKLGSVAKLQSVPTFFSQGSFVMKHVLDGTTYYDTMEWESIKSFHGSITIEPEKKYIVMLPEDDEVTNKFKVTFHYDDRLSGGMETSRLIPKELLLKFDNDKQVEEVPNTNPTYTFTKTYKRNTLINGRLNHMKEEANLNLDTLVGDVFKFNEKATFDIDVKMQGDISVNFTTNYDNRVYPEGTTILLDEEKWDSADDKVTIKLIDDTVLNAELAKAYKEAGKTLKVVSWNWYIRKTSGEFEQIGKPMVNQNMSYTLPFGTDYSFEVPDGERVVSTVQFKLEAMDSEGNKGEMIHSIKIKNKLKEKEDEEDETKPNEPPTAEIKIKEVLRAGQRGKASGSRSTDEDGKIVDYEWHIRNAEFKDGDRHGEYKKFYCLEVHNHSYAKLLVTDNDGASDEAKEYFDVINPLIPEITTYGTLKENRRVTISGDRSKGTTYYPIDWDKTEWKITPLDGQNPDSIKLDTDMSGREFDTLFKETGRYKVWMKIYATCTFEGYEDLTYHNEIEKIIEIKPDEKPISDMALRKIVYRNPDTDGIAVLNMADNSRSIDGDFIGHRKWSYAFDSNNDGSFDDEVFSVASDENEVMVQIEVNKVGNYLIKLEVTEEFGQPTIEKFVTPEDRRKDDNTEIPREDRTAEVQNVAPTVELNFDERKQVDLILLTDYTGQDLMDLRDQVDKLTMNLQEQKVDAKIYIFDNLLPSNSIEMGQRDDPIYRYSRKLRFSWVWGEIHRRTSSLEHSYRYNVYDDDVFTVESRTGTELQSKSFPTYPDAYGTYKYLDQDKYHREYEIKGYNRPGEEVFSRTDKIRQYSKYKSKYGTNYTKYEDIKNLKVTVDKKFYPDGISSHRWVNYNSLNTDKIKDIKLRDNSDRYLVTAVKFNKSLNYLDKDFKEYVRDNNIVVAASINKVAREYYARYFDFNDVMITKTAVYVKTPYGVKLKIGDSTGSASFLQLTDENVDFYDKIDGSIMMAVKSTNNTMVGYGDTEYGHKQKDIPTCYGNYSLSDSGNLSFNYKKISFYETSVWNASLSNASYPIDTEVKNIYETYHDNYGASNLLYEKNDGTWHFAMVNRRNYHSGRDPYYNYRVWSAFSSVTTKELDIDKLKSLSKRHVLAENGNMYFFDEYHSIHVGASWRSPKVSDLRAKLVVNIDKAIAIGNTVYFTYKNDYTLHRINKYSSNYMYYLNYPVAVDKIVDDMYTYNNTSVILFDDNTLMGGGLSDYCQVGTRSTYDNDDRTWSMVGLRNMYDSPIDLKDELESRAYIPPIELITEDVRNMLYDEGENEQLCNDIYEIYKKEDTDTAYILLGTKADMKTFYSDYENDSLYDYRWDVVHNEKYFENDLGKDPRAKLNGKPIDEFSYTGHYKIDLKVRDNPVSDDDRFDNYRLWNKDETVLNIYVHRKPKVRDGLYVKKKGNNLEVYARDEGSYDLDHLSQSNRGITKHDWYWRTDENRIWKNEQLNIKDAQYNTIYFLAHRVKDEEGEWSEIKYSELEIKDDIPIILSANLQAYNSSFDIDSMPVDERIRLRDIEVTYYDNVNLIATLEKDGTRVKELLNKNSDSDCVSKTDTGFDYEEIVERLPHNLNDGDYSVRIVATDLNNSSKTASLVLPFKINTPINLRAILPEQAIVGEAAEISCSSSVYTDKVKLTAFNDDASIRKVYDMTLKETNSTRKTWTADVDIPWSCKDRDYEFKFVGTVETDTPKSEELIEDMRIVVLEIAEIGIKGYWNHWRGQENMFGERMTVEPHRFLSHETVIIYGYIAGNPDKVYVEFSPQLQAMFFTDPAGNEYSYEEDIGYTVDFPLEMPLEKYRYYEVEYQLPIAWTTIDWDNDRVRNSYWMKVTAEKSGVKVSDQFDDIEITGTVYDLLYVQPYHKPDK